MKESLETKLALMTDEKFAEAAYKLAIMTATGIPVTDRRWEMMRLEEERRGLSVTGEAFLDAEKHLLSLKRHFSLAERRRMEITRYCKRTASRPDPAGSELKVVKASGDSMRGARIHDGDLLWYEQGALPEKGDIVIVNYFGYLLVKRYWRNGPSIALLSENPAYEDIITDDEREIDIIGIVRKVEFMCK